jgi:hypothetical protein
LITDYDVNADSGSGSFQGVTQEEALEFKNTKTLDPEKDMTRLVAKISDISVFGEVEIEFSTPLVTNDTLF